jgi:molybdopterin-dependent oxidoreductase-like protein protein
MRLSAAIPAALLLAVLCASTPGSAFAQIGAPAEQEPGSKPEIMPHDSLAKPAAVAGPLKISYEGKSEEWTPETLAKLPHKTVQVYNEHAKANQSYSGVLLTDLLTRLGVPDKPHGKEFRLYLIAQGSDGYEVVYSVGEVTPDVHDATILVADAMDGKPIAASGPLQLIATGEKRPARWVRNLVEIRVLTAE